jgi:hypothetical protein
MDMLVIQYGNAITALQDLRWTMMDEYDIQNDIMHWNKKHDSGVIHTYQVDLPGWMKKVKKNAKKKN